MKTPKWALATTLIALASCQPISAEMIKAIANQCGLDSNSVQNIADEVMAAKVIAETDMRHNIL